MKRSVLLLTILGGVAVFLVVLLLNLPASWVGFLLPAQVRCGEIGGSVWHGECLGLEYQNNKLGDATWNLSPANALIGHLLGDVDLRGAALNARSEINLTRSGMSELRNVTAQLTLDPALIPQMPRDQRGDLSAKFVHLQFGSGPSLRQAEGTLEVRNLRQVGAQPMELGSYQLTFNGPSNADGSVPGKLRDLGGPYIVEGTVTLGPSNNYVVQGYITGRTADAERVVREITLGARPDASGRSVFSFEGTY